MDNASRKSLYWQNVVVYQSEWADTGLGLANCEAGIVIALSRMMLEELASTHEVTDYKLACDVITWIRAGEGEHAARLAQDSERWQKAREAASHR